MKIAKDYRPLVKAAEAAGWVLEVTGKGHNRLRPPRGSRRPDGDLAAPVIFPASPSDHRGPANCRKQLRQNGVDA